MIIVTVSMSALWELNSGVQTYEAAFLRLQEFRTVPIVLTYSTSGVGRAGMGGTSTSDKVLQGKASVHKAMIGN